MLCVFFSFCCAATGLVLVLVLVLALPWLGITLAEPKGKTNTIYLTIPNMKQTTQSYFELPLKQTHSHCKLKSIHGLFNSRLSKYLIGIYFITLQSIRNHTVWEKKNLMDCLLAHSFRLLHFRMGFGFFSLLFMCVCGFLLLCVNVCVLKFCRCCFRTMNLNLNHEKSFKKLQKKMTIQIKHIFP